MLISSTKIDSILHDIRKERARQDELKRQGRFAKTCADDMTNPERLAVLAEEVGEASHEVNETIGGHAPLDTEMLRKELVQIAAVCVAWIEGLDASDRYARPVRSDDENAAKSAAVARVQSAVGVGRIASVRIDSPVVQDARAETEKLTSNGLSDADLADVEGAMSVTDLAIAIRRADQDLASLTDKAAARREDRRKLGREMRQAVDAEIGRRNAAAED